MEIDLQTMLDIALGGPEIGPLNLQVLHGIMREVFQRIDLSNQNIVVEKESSEFCNSFNFIKSKIDEKNKRPRTAGGSYQRFKSNVSVIVSDYVRVPIGEQFGESKVNLPSSIDVEDRLRYIESELKNVKDFPSIDDLRNWAKEKTNPDTVVTDLWHFVSLNHRVNGLEEGIQKLTTLVDKLIPELKSLGEEQNLVNGKVDDLYSQFKGLSDRMTYIDSKIDSKIDNVNKTIEEQIQSTVDLTKHVEKKLLDHPKFRDLDKLVTIDVFNEAQEMARATVNDIREQLSSKLNYSILDKMVSQDDFQNFVDILNSVDTKIIDCAKINDLDKFATNDSYMEVQENAKNMAKEVDIMNVTLAGKADISAIDGIVIQADVDKLSKRIDGLANIAEQQTALSNKLNSMQGQLMKKADNDDIIDVLKKEDMKKTLNKIQNHQHIINEIQSWQKSFDSEEKPLLNSKVNELMVQTSGIRESLSNLHNERMKNPREEVDVSGLDNSFKQLLDQFNEHDKTCKSYISGIINDVELKLDKTEIQPLKDYLENCYNTLAQQHQDSLNNVPQCNHQTHQPKPPKPFQGMPHISQSSINISKKTIEELGCNHDTYIPSKSDAAVVRSQMKFNCLSCSQPLSASSHNQFQTIRGKPLNAYELDHLRLLQKMLNPDSIDKDNRACGGRHTSSIPYKKTGRSSARNLPAMAFTNQEGILIDGEVDIEGLDGKLYRGLISKKDFLSHNRCKSANADLRTVSPKPGKGADFR